MSKIIPVPARPADALLAWLESVSSDGQSRGLCPIDLAIFRECLIVARSLVVFHDPFLSNDAGADVARIVRRHAATMVEQEDVLYKLGIAVGLELAGSFYNLPPDDELPADHAEPFVTMDAIGGVQ